MADRKHPVRRASPQHAPKTTPAPSGSFVTISGRVELPPEALADLETHLAAFNRKKLKGANPPFFATVKGKFVFVSREMLPRQFDPMFRLEWHGAVDDWDFAIYRYSDEAYDHFADFPGRELLDGTVAGALKAVHKAYPPDWAPGVGDMESVLAALLGMMSHPLPRPRRSGKR